MPRPDLLALSPDDLATLANRGLMKRAQAELQNEDLEYTLSENKAGTVSVLWSDDVHCLLPSNVPLTEAKCSCPATTLCRHLIRSVLAYQKEHANEAEPAAETEAAAEASTEAASTETSPSRTVDVAWNPGEVTDETLNTLLAPALLTRARREWENGHVVELSLGARPSAFFHTASVNLRFLVANDVRYTHCDCADPAPCVHVPLAVWAFRQSRQSQAETGQAAPSLISTRSRPLAVPVKLLDELEAAVQELAIDGVSNASHSLLERLTRLERECNAESLIWPATIVAELRVQLEYYRAHNARFEPVRVAQLLGELLIRADAIRNDTGVVPPLFVRGSTSQRSTEVGAARLTGLGTRARFYRGGVELHAFLQDMDSGAVVTVNRDFPDPQLDANAQLLRGTVGKALTTPEPAQLWKLASFPVTKGVRIGALGGGQLLVRGGKRTPSGEFLLGRAPVSFNLQTFDWDKLRAPLLVDNFGALDRRLQSRPPAALRPRREGEDIHVVPLSELADVSFNRAEQSLRATLRDREGGHATLVHPFTARGAEGFEALLMAATHQPQEFRFVAARFARHAGRLVAAPLALVQGDGPSRRALQPWVERGTTKEADGVSQVQDLTATPHQDEGHITREFVDEMIRLIGETLQVGLRRTDAMLTRQWQMMSKRSTGLGFDLVAEFINQVTNGLDRKSRVRQWEPSAITPDLLNALVSTCLLSEMI